jgi:ADP-glucose pyrophosphorylase
MRPKGAWYDLGGPSQYLDSQLRMLRRRRGGRLVLAGARIAPDARVSRCVIGRASVVGAGAQVTDSVLWEKVRIGAGARVSRCVLADGATIAAGERIEGQVVTKTERRPL